MPVYLCTEVQIVDGRAFMIRKKIALLLALMVLFVYLPDRATYVSVVQAAKGDTFTTEDGIVYQDYGNSTAIITGYVGEADEITIPAAINDYAVTTIGNDAFMNTNLKKIIISEGISKIMNSSFTYMDNLEELILQESMQSKYPEAFTYCKLKTLYVPSKVTDLSFLHSMNSFVHIDISPDNTAYKSIDGVVYTKDMKTLYYYPKYKAGTMRVPYGVTSIAESAFFGAENITGIILPDSVTSIGAGSITLSNANAFVRVPSSVTEIGQYNFSVYNVVFGEKGSVAEEYVKSKGYPFMEDKCGFVDVRESDFYYEPVLWACQTDPQITSGVNDTHFKPLVTCNRAQMVTFLWRCAGCPEPNNNNNPFNDVNENDFFYKATLWAVEKGITAGKTEETFSPYEGCSRGQFVVFVWRMCNKQRPEVEGTDFVDIDPESELGKAVRWTNWRGLTQGIDATHFGPKKDINRAQAVSILFRGRLFVIKDE